MIAFRPIRRAFMGLRRQAEFEIRGGPSVPPASAVPDVSMPLTVAEHPSER
jgi:hypothetical protein